MFGVSLLLMPQSELRAFALAGAVKNSTVQVVVLFDMLVGY